MADKDPGPGHSMFGLNDEPTRRAPAPEAAQALPQSVPGAPQYVLVQQPQQMTSSGGGKALPWLLAVVAALAIANLVLVLMDRSQFSDYAMKQADATNLMTRRMDSSDQRYAELNGEFRVTQEKLGVVTKEDQARAHALAAEVQKQQETAVAQLNQAIAQKASADEVNKLQADSNSKIGSLNTDLAGTKQDLASTKSEFTNALAGTKGELSGSIARTHDELVALAHKGDKDYFEFTLPRKKAQQKIGTVTVELERTDPKKNVFSVFLTFDDKRTERSNRAMNEPVDFYVQGALMELVVNKLGKDSVSGYISAPKGSFPNQTNVLGQRPGA